MVFLNLQIDRIIESLNSAGYIPEAFTAGGYATASVMASATAPITADTGDLWLKTTDSTMYVYTGSEWEGIGLTSEEKSQLASLSQYIIDAEAQVSAAEGYAIEAKAARDKVYALTVATGAEGTQATFNIVSGILTIPKGDTGLQGIQGIQGEVGPEGPQGIQGIEGPQGVQGIQGVQGDIGPKGDTGTGLVVKGTDTSANIVLKSGIEGDFWIASDTGDGYSYVGGVWINTGQVRGPQGIQGPQGVQGEIGLTGPQGIQGVQGEHGIQGIQGIQGEVGLTGPKGDDGLITSVTAGTGISIDSTNPASPVVSVSGADAILIIKPIITSPLNGATDFTGEVKTDTYSTSASYEGVQDFARWKATNLDGSVVYDSYEGSSNLTSWTPSIGLALTQVYVSMQKGSDGHISQWSDVVSFTTPNIFIETPTLTVTGTPTDVPETPTLTTSAFSVFNGTDTHESTTFTVKNSVGEVIWTETKTTGDLLTTTVSAGILEVSSDYTFEAYHTGATYGNSSAVVVSGTTASSFAAVVGLNWNETQDTYERTGDASSWGAGALAVDDFSNNVTPQATMRRCVLNANGTVNYYLHPTDSTLKEDGVTSSVLDGTDGNVMVEVKKFYRKYEYDTSAGDVIHKHTISLAPIDGGFVDPAFVQNGVEKDYRYYAAYQGSDVAGKLMSVSGAYVKTDLTRDGFRTMAEANGAGWHVTDWHLFHAIQMLMVIEYGSFDLQSELGEGRTCLTGGAWANSSYYGIHGNSNSDGNFSNNDTQGYSSTNMVNAGLAAADLIYMTYRGCENFWGNVRLFVDGINVNDNIVYLNDNPATFADDTITNYTQDVTMINASGYPTALANSNKGFFPSAVGGSNSTFIPDYYAQATGWRVVLVGGDGTDGLYAGPLFLLASTGSAYVTVAIGAAVSF